MERIGDIYYERKDGVMCPILNLTKSSREHTWVTHEQIALEYPEAITLMGNILHDKHYDERAKNFVRSLLFFLSTDGHLSWKQFDSIFFIFESYDAYKAHIKDGTLVRNGHNLVAVRRGALSFVGNVTHLRHEDIGPLRTDRDVDRLYKRIFGTEPTFPDMYNDDGDVDYDLAYRADGSRMFLLPTEESLNKQGIEAFMSDSDRYHVAAFFDKSLR
jgi:hypothetical protein